MLLEVVAVTRKLRAKVTREGKNWANQSQAQAAGSLGWTASDSGSAQASLLPRVKTI